MKNLAKMAFAALGVAAFAFLLWKSDQDTQEPPSALPQKALEKSSALQGGGSHQAPPAISAVPPDSEGDPFSSGYPATRSRTVAGSDIPGMAASVDASRSSLGPNQPASTETKNSPAVAGGPAVVDMPMDWGQPVREISIPVPRGEMVPAVFQDDAPKPAAQMKALDRIAAEFEQNVREVPPGMTEGEVWGLAREIADERYLTLFGYQAYNQYHTQAAKEALKEKRARANSAGP